MHVTFFGEKRAHARIKVLQTMVANRAGRGKAGCSNLRTLFHALFSSPVKNSQASENIQILPAFQYLFSQVFVMKAVVSLQLYISFCA